MHSSRDGHRCASSASDSGKCRGKRVTACRAAARIGKSELEWELKVMLGSSGRESSGECIVTMRRDRSIRPGATSAGTCSDVATAASRGAQKLTLVVRRVSILLVPPILAPWRGPVAVCAARNASSRRTLPKATWSQMQSRLHVHRRTSASAGARLAAGILHTAACPHPTPACYLSASWQSALSISFFYARVPNLAPEVAKTKLLTLMTSETLTPHAHPHDCSISA
jgi:hypothetical protein